MTTVLKSAADDVTSRPPGSGASSAADSSAEDETYVAQCIASHHAAERQGIPRERRGAPALVGALLVAGLPLVDARHYAQKTEPF